MTNQFSHSFQYMYCRFIDSSYVIFFRQDNNNIKIYIIFITHNVSQAKLVGCHVYVIKFHMPSSKDQCISPSNHKLKHKYRFHKLLCSWHSIRRITSPKVSHFFKCITTQHFRILH